MYSELIDGVRLIEGLLLVANGELHELLTHLHLLVVEFLQDPSIFVQLLTVLLDLLLVELQSFIQNINLAS